METLADKLNLPRCPHCRRTFDNWSFAKRHVKFCSVVSDYFPGPKEGKSKEKQMTTMGETRKKKGKGGPPLLHGSDVPAKVSQFTIKVKELREPPENFNAFGILDFSEPVYEKEGMAVNQTNMKQLANRLGFDIEEFDSIEFADLAARAKGKKLTVQVVLKNNPTTHQMVRALDIA